MLLSAQQAHMYSKLNKMSSETQRTQKAYKRQSFYLQRNGQQIVIIILINNAECHKTIEPCLKSMKENNFELKNCFQTNY